MLRLDRYLSNATTLTRSQAQRALRGGRVTVDGEIVKQGATQVPLGTRVMLDGVAVAPPLPCYFMLNKPIGVVSATRDPSQRTVLDLLDVPKRTGLHIAGRLDIDSSGLVLVTDDGQWSHRITAPSNHCPKSYAVTLAGPLTVGQITKLETGLLLKGETKPTKPATVEQLSALELRLTITEGRYHQVKRMFAALGNHVEGLHRLSIGGLLLDQSLLPGEYRPLTPREVGLF
ncbi:MAG: 16S rRNA pseudouridine(516) synthase [gamma proteobacterium symbiont of Ctena orbiculata]|nr:MAG: 16S rRNA pseudouridine(516) synthase [gamma proteobacterium symbiont of Ctena orbiculata]